MEAGSGVGGIVLDIHSSVDRSVCGCLSPLRCFLRGGIERQKEHCTSACCLIVHCSSY